MLYDVMLIHMRTTLVLDDQLVRAAKQRAAEADITLSEVVNQALRASVLAPRPPHSAPFRMPTFRGRGHREVSPAEIAKLRDDDFALR